MSGLYQASVLTTGAYKGKVIAGSYNLDNCIDDAKAWIRMNPRDTVQVTKTLGRLYILNESDIRADSEITHYSEHKQEKTND